MSPPTILLTLLLLLLSLQSAQSWTFVWQNASNQSFVEHGSGTQSCKKINHAKSHEFSWDPEDDNSNTHCLSLFRDDSCASRAGYSCPVWQKNASLDLLSFNVFPEGSTSTSLTSTSISTSSPTQTSTAAPQSQVQSSAAGLSPGAIAGIVISSVAGFFLIAGVLWFLYRRASRSAVVPVSSPAPAEYPPPPFAPFPPPGHPPPQITVTQFEKPADDGVRTLCDKKHELSAAEPLHELEGGTRT